MNSPLAFYDHARQSYADSVPIRGTHTAEFMIGGYDPHESGVDERGEFMIKLHDFDRERWFPLPERPRKPLSPQICVFTDAFDALKEFAQAGGLDALENATIHSNDDLTHLLLSLGLRDTSHTPLVVSR